MTTLGEYLATLTPEERKHVMETAQTVSGCSDEVMRLALDQPINGSIKNLANDNKPKERT